jgi:Tfp pilus tip-associated adhesin PilY1
MDKKLLAKLIAGIFGTAPFLAAVSEQALAAGTDIATSPLANRRSSDIKPNIMLVFDDSGSMMSDYMPDSAGNNDPYGPGYRNHLCNTIYYNPNPTNPSTPLSPYLVPRAETGVNLNSADPASFAAAYDNGYWFYDQIGQASGTATRTNLGANQGWGESYPLNPSGQAAYYWSLMPASSAGVTPTASVCASLPVGDYIAATGVCSSNSAAPYNGTYSLVTTASPTDATCSTASGGAQPNLIWKKIAVSDTSSPTASYDERVRYANWFSYYRNRMQMTKSAIGRAFLPLIGKKKYRAGFITIAPQALGGGAAQSAVYSYNSAALYNSKFLEIRNFDSVDLATNQPNRWFNILYAQQPNGQTPLREGLSRVGRYYAGKNDGPNSGMIPSNTADPVQYACQQNFSILTTDGYWNVPAGATGYSGSYTGGFKTDYSLAMDNQDGNIAETDAYGQGLSIGARPIYDGTRTSAATTTDANNAYQNLACTYYLQSTQQILKSTLQELRSTQQQFTWTNQPLTSTSQRFRALYQESYSTVQKFTRNQVPLRSTNQKFESTRQEVASTSQLVTFDRWTIKRTNQFLGSTSQILQTDKVPHVRTSQRFSKTEQRFRKTDTILQTTSQLRIATSQRFVSTSQRFASTEQRFVSTKQQVESTFKYLRCNSVGGGCVPAATCTPVAETTTCSSVTTGPTVVNSCSAGTNTSTWITTTCVTSTTGPTGIATCTPSTNTSTWITTSCSTSTTSNVATSSCSAGTNTTSWVTTTCVTSTTGPAAAAASACTPSTNTSTWLTTTCSTTTTGPTGVTACTGSTNTSTWVTTTCSTSTAANVAVSACTAGTNTTSWVTTTCSTSTVAYAAISACAAGTNTSTWVTTSCSTSTTSFAAIASCTGSTNTTTWVTTICSTTTTGPTAASSCTASTNTGTWVTTTCSTSTAGPTGVTACAAGTNTTSWVTTTCSTSTTASVATSVCTAGTNTTSWVTTSCVTSTTGPTTLAASACSPGTNTSTWVTTTCSTSTTAATGVSTCTNSTNTTTWVTTVCATLTSSYPMSVCVAAAATTTNSWIATTCATTTTTNVPVSACTPGTNTGTWVTTTCSTSTTTNVAASSCSAGTNTTSWVTTTCTTSTTGYVAASSCSPGTNSSTWVTTDCSTTTVGPTGITACAAGTNTTTWVTTSCSTTSGAFTAITACAAGTNTTSWITTSCSTTTTSNIPAASCSAGTNTGTWVTTTCTTSTTASVATAACTPASDTSTWISTVCSTTNTGPTGVSSCATGTNTTTWVTTNCSTSITTDVPVASCAAGTNTTSWVSTTCDTTSSPLNTTNVLVQTTCSEAAVASNSYVSTTCASQAGTKNQYQTQTRTRTDYYSDAIVVGSTAYPAWGGSFPAAGSWIDFSLCLPAVPAAWPTWPAAATGQPGPTDPATPPYTSIDGACTGWPCTHVDATVTGGSSNSLADVAQYYYKTDLRPAGTTGFNGLNVSQDIVPSSATDPTEGDMGKWQHMTTFTMGLGVSGNIAYNKNYKDKPIGTFTLGVPNEPFQQIRCQDSSNAPLGDPNLCLNWPLPVAAQPSAVDDLWHAAVNGRGQYFSAADPDAVFTGLQTALLAINAQSGAGTGATTSTQDPVPGNDLTFRAGFRTVDWTGDIRAQQLYTGTNLALEGTVLPGLVWSAQDKLDGKVGSLCDNRTIHLLRMGATNNMVPFTWNTRACDGSGNPTGTADTGLSVGEQNNFASASSAYASPFNMSSWSQFLDMTDGTNGVDQRALAQGANLVNFLRGQRGMEDFTSGSTTKLFRKRVHVLGDIVGSQPRYVTAPNANFTDTGYSLYKQKSGVIDRPAMLYAGGNDGMLHAFKVGTSVSDAEGGSEMWAVIPTEVVPNLYRLGDAGYSESHTYYVDSTPSTGDVYDKHQVLPEVCAGQADPTLAKDCWKTIIAGGLGSGGRGYYAIDVTTPTSPKALWEFKWSDTCYDPSVPATHSADCHIGLTFGAPLITKLVDGNWVVLVSSGLNNINSPAKAGDGKGYLYVLDAITGKILKKISTGVGAAASDVAALSGTLTLSATAAVTGSGTAFTTELFPGQTITVNGESRVVQTISDATHLSVSAAFTGSGAYAGTVVRAGPSGLAFMNAYVENYIQDNTSERVYGGDMLGNVWRFELKALSDSTDEAVRLATVVDPSGNPQPITTTPQLMNVGAAQTRMVFVGTGRYLGESDLSDTQTQTVYGLAENLNLHNASPAYISNGNTVLPTAGLTLRQQLNRVVLSTLSTAAGDAVTDANTRKSTGMGCSTEAAAAGVACSGWYADLPATGERVNLDMRLVLGSLIVPTNVTNLTACDIGGNSWLNVFDAATGTEVPGSAYKAGKYMPGAITVGISLIRGQSGRILSVLTKSDDTQQVSEVQTQQAAPLGRRSGWRDLLN